MPKTEPVRSQPYWVMRTSETRPRILAETLRKSKAACEEVYRSLPISMSPNRAGVRAVRCRIVEEV